MPDENRKILVTNLNKYLKMAGKKRIDVAEDLEIGQSTIFSWFNGQSYPRAEALQQLANYFGISVADLLLDETNKNELDLKSKTVDIPILGRINCGNPSAMFEEIIGYEEIPAKMAKTGDFFGLRAKGDSMFPDIKNNDFLIVKKMADVSNGDIAIVCISNDDAVCKKILKIESGIGLVPLNHSHKTLFFSNDEIEMLPVRILGRVVEIRRKY